MSKLINRGLSLIILTLVLSFSDVCAKDSQQSITPAQAAQKAQQQVNGRVLRVAQSKHTYQVKVLQNSGRVVIIDVDKRTGRVTKQRSKDK